MSSLLRIFLSVGLFVGFAAGGIVAANLVQGDEVQLPALDVSAGPGSQLEVDADSEPGGAFVPFVSDGGADGGGGGSGAGRGASGGGANGGGAATPDPAAGDGGQAPDGGAPPVDDGGGVPADGGGAPADGDADPAAPAAAGGEQGVDEGDARWLDACAGDAGGERRAGCPLGVGANILGLDPAEQLPFLITAVESGPRAAEDFGCGPAHPQPDLDLVVVASHPAGVVVRHAGGVAARSEAAPGGARFQEWEQAIEVGDEPIVAHCLVIKDLPDGPGRYELDVTAVSALPDLEPRPRVERTVFVNLDTPSPRPATRIEFIESSVTLRITAAANLPDGGGAGTVLPFGTLLPADGSCADAQGAQFSSGAVSDFDGVSFKAGDRIEGAPAGWTHWMSPGVHWPEVEEGQRYWVCLSWAQDGAVIDQEQHLVTTPDWHRYRVFVERANFREEASGLRFGIDTHCGYEGIVVQAPMVPSGTEFPLSVAELLLDTGSRFPSNAVQVCTQQTGRDASGVGIDDPRVCECPGRVRIELPRSVGGPTSGNARVRLNAVVDSVARQGDDPGVPGHVAQVGHVVLRWEHYDDDGYEHGGGFDVGPAQDFAAPVLDLAQSSVTLVDGDPIRPAATLTLVADRPVTGSVRALTDTCAPPAPIALGPAAATHAVTFTDLCPGSLYRFVVELTDASGTTVYYAANGNDWPPVGNDGSQRRSWPAADLRMPHTRANVTFTMEISPDDETTRGFVNDWSVRLGPRAPLPYAETGCLRLGEELAESVAEGVELADPVAISVRASVTNECSEGGDRREVLFFRSGPALETSLFNLVSRQIDEFVFNMVDRNDRFAGEVILRVKSVVSAP